MYLPRPRTSTGQTEAKRGGLLRQAREALLQAKRDRDEARSQREQIDSELQRTKDMLANEREKYNEEHERVCALLVVLVVSL